MININILEKDDVLEADDWCRPLQLAAMSGGHSDDYSFKSMYTGRPENNVKWCKVKHIFPAWVGKTVKQTLSRPIIGQYEFVRGKIPTQHTHPEGR